MGSDNRNLIVKKCGDILMNLKKNNKKSKTYTFHCSFCGTTCDQMDKFSVHLEEFHLENFDDDNDEESNDSVMVYEPDIKNESRIEGESKEIENEILPAVENVPLGTEGTDDLGPSCDNNVQIKQEKNELSDCEFLSIKTEEVCFDDGCTNDGNFSDSDRDESYSRNEEIELSTDSVSKDKSYSCTEDIELSTDCDSKNNFDEFKLLIVIELYMKYEELWQVNNIYFGITAKRTEIYNRMVEDLESDYNIKITFSDLKTYINYIHVIYSKDKERELKSELDKSDFSPAFKHYEKLMFLKDSRGPFKCPHCNDIIEIFESYRIHVADHTDTKPFKCLLCESHFKKFRLYLMHVNRHINVNRYRCNICGKGFVTKFQLEKHKPSHTYICQICDASFRHSSDYDKHMRRHEKRFRFECHICKQGFNRLYNLNTHVKSHLNVRDFLCNICGKGFTSLSYLKNHKLIHDDEKRFKCDVCGMEYAQSSSLRSHLIRKHNRSTTTAATKTKKEEFDNHICGQEKRYRFECYICKKGFSQLGNMNTHIKSHLNVRDFLCNVCGKGFTSLSYLKNHKLIHDDEKRFKCDICGMKYAQKASLRSHLMRTHNRTTTSAATKTKREKEKPVLD